MADPRLRIANTISDRDECHVLDALAQPHITVIGPTDPSPSQSLALAVLHALLIRTFPNTAAPLRDHELPVNPWAAATLSAAVARQPQSPARQHPTPRPITVSVSTSPGIFADYYIDGDDWTAYVSTSGPSRGFETPRYGGLGLQAAIALAVGEIFKVTLTNLGLRTNQLDGTLIWNLLDYSLEPANPRRSATSPKPQQLLFAGAGSLGSSAIAALAATGLAATADAVDDDTFDPAHNPFRYPAATTSTDGPKVAWAAQIASGSNLSVTPHNQRIDEWARQQREPGFQGTAIVTVDRVDGRLDAASILPRETIASGVSGLSIQLHRARATDTDSACSYCLYVDAEQPLDQLETYTELTGIAEPRIAELLEGSRLLPADLAHRSLSSDLVGRRIEDLVRAAYAEATVTLEGASEPADITAPHVSWLAGVTIAAEVVKRALELPTLDRRLRLDLRGLPLGITDRPRPDPTGRCICHSPVRRAAATSWY